MDGFAALVQKEWLWFGHQFARRCGNPSLAEGSHSSSFRDASSQEDGSLEPNASVPAASAVSSSGKDPHQVKTHREPLELAPIFVQFLDCVHQLMRQFPHAFEFNEEYLLLLAQHVYSRQFGTFFCNSEYQREITNLAGSTVSFWHELAERRGRLVNRFYVAPLSVRAMKDQYLRSASSPACLVADRSAPFFEFVLMPSPSLHSLRVWTGYFAHIPLSYRDPIARIPASASLDASALSALSRFDATALSVLHPAILATVVDALYAHCDGVDQENARLLQITAHAEEEKQKLQQQVQALQHQLQQSMATALELQHSLVAASQLQQSLAAAVQQRVYDSRTPSNVISVSSSSVNAFSLLESASSLPASTHKTSFTSAADLSAIGDNLSNHSSGNHHPSSAHHRSPGPLRAAPSSSSTNFSVISSRTDRSLDHDVGNFISPPFEPAPGPPPVEAEAGVPNHAGKTIRHSPSNLRQSKAASVANLLDARPPPPPHAVSRHRSTGSLYNSHLNQTYPVDARLREEWEHGSHIQSPCNTVTPPPPPPDPPAALPDSQFDEERARKHRHQRASRSRERRDAFVVDVEDDQTFDIDKDYLVHQLEDDREPTPTHDRSNSRTHRTGRRARDHEEVPRDRSLSRNTPRESRSRSWGAPRDRRNTPRDRSHSRNTPRDRSRSRDTPRDRSQSRDKTHARSRGQAKTRDRSRGRNSEKQPHRSRRSRSRGARGNTQNGHRARPARESYREQDPSEYDYADRNSRADSHIDPRQFDPSLSSHVVDRDLSVTRPMSAAVAAAVEYVRARRERSERHLDHHDVPRWSAETVSAEPLNSTFIVETDKKMRRIADDEELPQRVHQSISPVPLSPSALVDPDLPQGTPRSFYQVSGPHSPAGERAAERARRRRSRERRAEGEDHDRSRDSSMSRSVEEEAFVSTVPSPPPEEQLLTAMTRSPRFEAQSGLSRRFSNPETAAKASRTKRRQQLGKKDRRGGHTSVRVPASSSADTFDGYGGTAAAQHNSTRDLQRGAPPTRYEF